MHQYSCPSLNVVPSFNWPPGLFGRSRKISVNSLPPSTLKPFLGRANHDPQRFESRLPGSHSTYIILTGTDSHPSNIDSSTILYRLHKLFLHTTRKTTPSSARTSPNTIVSTQCHCASFSRQTIWHVWCAIRMKFFHVSNVMISMVGMHDSITIVQYITAQMGTC